MTTFNFNPVDNFYYFIDSVANFITINSKCDYPCKDCPFLYLIDGVKVYDTKVCIACFEDLNIP